MKANYEGYNIKPSYATQLPGSLWKKGDWCLAIVLSLLKDDTDDGAAGRSPMTHRRSCLVTNPK